MPKLAAFPKAYMQGLCKDGSMTLDDWIELAAPLGLDGLEYYSGFLELADQRQWARARRAVEASGMVIPMLCCSPDFTNPDFEFRRREVGRQLMHIDMAAELGARFCRVLSGQDRPELTRELGLDYAIACIETCLPYAQSRGITLILENHYKDDFWLYPEFAMRMELFCELVHRIRHPNFGVNFDPSNAYIAGEDPLELLRRVKQRVVTMHASDRYLIEGTIEDLRREELGAEGYVRRLRHGEVGKGLNDYDAIFRELKSIGFDGWISIEDGVDGIEQLAASVRFVRGKIAQHFNGAADAARPASNAHS